LKNFTTFNTQLSTSNIQNRMNCVLANKDQITANDSIMMGLRESRHIVDVLGKKVGDVILAGVIDGPMGNVPVLEVTSDGVRIGIPKGQIPPVAPVDMILAMPRPKVMKRLWAPLASMGLHRITLIAAERVEPFYFDSHAVSPTVYEPLLIEGLEQARDTRMPIVKVVTSFSWFAEKHLPAIKPTTIKLIGQPGAQTSVRSSFSCSPNPQSVVAAVGPEGGWTRGEIDVFQANGFIPVGLRDRALRTDTAIVSLLTLVYDALGN